MDFEQGLTEQEAAKRLARDGRNELQKKGKRNVLLIFLDQLKDPLIYVLVAAAVISALLGEYSDAGIIVAVVLLNACVGVVQEGKARKALEALESLQSPTAIVIREGIKREIPASEIVRGDLVCLEAGAGVPADVRILEAVELRLQEAALTGESVPVAKKVFLFSGRAEDEEAFWKASGEADEKIPLADRKSMAFMTTVVTSGKGKGIVVATGMHTEIGKIADMIHGEKEDLTPLQKRLGELGTVLSVLSVLLCGGLFGVAVLQKRNVMEMLLTAISLAVAAVPEGLPAVVTICLAFSVTKMVRANTIVRKLPSVETLGCVSVVCSDKTGTLTSGKMSVEKGFWDGKIREVHRVGENPPQELLRGMVLCNDALFEKKNISDRRRTRLEEKMMGDPTEIALLELAGRFGMEKSRQERSYPRLREIPFSSERKEMTTYHQGKGECIAYCKGAPDVLLQKCHGIMNNGVIRVMQERERKKIQDVIMELSEEAYRLLAVGMSKEDGEWVFLGILALRDPVRPKAHRSVEILKCAGVNTVMITGDHVKTALAIGRQLKIADGPGQCITGREIDEQNDARLAKMIREKDLRIFARVSPAQKVRIVKAFQSMGEIVAMTGDGVNDAPSLKAADIGIAMGKNGTDVAKQAADLVLTDDDFSTIERAIALGRGVYENIRKAVIFLLSSNLGELMTMFVSVVFGFAAPLKSAHILWINLITDSLPALALGVDQNDSGELMRHLPRKSSESIFARGGLGCTCFYGILITAVSLTAFFLPLLPMAFERNTIPEMLAILKSGLKQDCYLTRGQTYAFTVLGMSQLFHAVGMRDVNVSVFHRKLGRNPVMLLAVVLGFGLQLAVTEIPVLVHAFGTAHLQLTEWGILVGLASAPLIAHEMIVLFIGTEKT